MCQNNQASGDWNTIYSLAGTWRPVEMLTLRGNYTRSIRQPSITELFLGGQPAFLAAGYLRQSGVQTAVSVGALITAVGLFTALVIMIHSSSIRRRDANTATRRGRG